MYQSSVKASEAISTLEDCDQEIRNVGRQSMHYMSFAMLVNKSLKLLRKNQDEEDQCEDGLVADFLDGRQHTQ